MIESYFGLARRPFLAIPDVSSYFHASCVESARTTIGRCLDRGEGVSLIIGSSGIGKTLLLRILEVPFQMEYAVARFSNTRLRTPKSFLQQLLFELHQPFSGSDETELRLLLLEYLRRSSLKGIVLLIDEAQSLTLPVFEEIRLLLNYDDGHFPRFRVALAGTATLEERLTHPKLTSFNQLVVSRSYLEPFSGEETSQYILWQLRHAKKGDIMLTEHENEILFDESARKCVHQLTEGIPRLVNQLCGHTLVYAYETRQTPINSAIVRSAWSQLQQIPEPATSTELAGSMVESGSTTKRVGWVQPVASVESDRSDRLEDQSGCVEFGILEDETIEYSPTVAKELIEVVEHSSNVAKEPIEVVEQSANVAKEPIEVVDYQRAVAEEENHDGGCSEAREDRLESQHVYQSRTFFESAYPSGVVHAAFENWSSPGHEMPYGFATPYRAVFPRSNEIVPPTVVVPLGMECCEPKTDDSRCSLNPVYFGFETLEELQQSENLRGDNQGDSEENKESEKNEENKELDTIWESVVEVFSDMKGVGTESLKSTVVRLHVEPQKGRKMGKPTIEEVFDEEIPVHRSQAKGVAAGSKRQKAIAEKSSAPSSAPSSTPSSVVNAQQPTGFKQSSQQSSQQSAGSQSRSLEKRAESPTMTDTCSTRRVSSSESSVWSMKPDLPDCWIDPEDDLQANIAENPDTNLRSLQKVVLDKFGRRKHEAEHLILEEMREELRTSSVLFDQENLLSNHETMQDWQDVQVWDGVQDWDDVRDEFQLGFANEMNNFDEVERSATQLLQFPLQPAQPNRSEVPLFVPLSLHLKPLGVYSELFGDEEPKTAESTSLSLHPFESFVARKKTG